MMVAFQADIMLICSNAMRYNAPNTVYYKQVTPRSMMEQPKDC